MVVHRPVDPGAVDEVVHAVEAAQHRGLAAARRADERGDLAPLDGEADVAHGAERAVVHVEVRPRRRPCPARDAAMPPRRRPRGRPSDRWCWRWCRGACRALLGRRRRRSLVLEGEPRGDEAGDQGEDEDEEDEGEGRAPGPVLRRRGRAGWRCGRSGPRASCSVRTGSSSTSLVTPMVNSSGAVSPAARATASIAPLTMPRQGRGQHHGHRSCGSVRAPRAVAALAQLVGHELEHLLGGADDDRQHQAGQCERAGEARLVLEASRPTPRR